MTQTDSDIGKCQLPINFASSCTCCTNCQQIVHIIQLRKDISKIKQVIKRSVV